MDLKTKLVQFKDFEGEISFKLVDNKEISWGIIKEIQEDYVKVFIGGTPDQETNTYIPLDKIVSLTVKEDK